MAIPALGAIIAGAKALLGKAVVKQAAKTAFGMAAQEAAKRVTNKDNPSEVIDVLRKQVEELGARAQEQEVLNSALVKQGQHVAEALSHIDKELAANAARQEVVDAIGKRVEELETRAQEQGVLNSEIAKQGQYVAEALSGIAKDLEANTTRQVELISQMASRSKTLLLVSGAATIIAIVALVFALIQ